MGKTFEAENRTFNEGQTHHLQATTYVRDFGLTRGVRLEVSVSAEGGPRTEAMDVDIADAKRLATFLTAFVAENS